MNENEDVMLPEGYEEGKDFFAEPEEQAEPADEAPSTTGDQPAEEAPAETDALPTTEQPPTTGSEDKAGDKLRFTVSVDHSDRDVELDPAELPALYQRAQVTDRVQQRLGQLQPRVEQAERMARTLGYENLDDMLEKAEQRYLDGEVNRLVSEGTPKGVAEFIAMQKAKEARAAASAPPSLQAPPTDPAPAGTRDFAGELAALKKVFPDAARDGRLPDEVVQAAARDGQPLVAAYAVWDAKQMAAENEQLKKDLAVLRQNAANAAKAPVSGTAGGGDTRQEPVDDFLRGFLEE